MVNSLAISLSLEDKLNLQTVSVCGCSTGPIYRTEDVLTGKLSSFKPNELSNEVLLNRVLIQCYLSTNRKSCNTFRCL